MRDGSDRGDTLGSHHRAFNVGPLEACFHATMLEKESRLIVDDVFPDIEEREFC